MIIGTVRMTVRLFGVESLKEKRSIIKRFLNECRRKFNASVCELDLMDHKEYFVLGIAMISNERSHMDSMVTEVTNYLEKEAPGIVTDMKTEIF